MEKMVRKSESAQSKVLRTATYERHSTAQSALSHTSDNRHRRSLCTHIFLCNAWDWEYLSAARESGRVTPLVVAVAQVVVERESVASERPLRRRVRVRDLENLH